MSEPLLRKGALLMEIAIKTRRLNRALGNLGNGGRDDKKNESLQRTRIPAFWSLRPFVGAARHF